MTAPNPAKIYYARHMFPGPVEYHNERVLVDEQAVLKLQPTFKGKPVYVGHGKYMNNLAGTEAHSPDGYVSDSFRNGVDSWSWVKFVAVSDEAVQKIENENYSVSNGWQPKQWEAHGGTFHNVKYDRRLRDAEYTHLALVPDPRYEESKVFTEAQYKAYVKDMKANHELHNSKGKTMNLNLKFWKTKKEEIDMQDLENMSLTVGDKEYSVQEMLNAVTAAEEKKKADETAEAAAQAEKEKQNQVDVLTQEVEVAGTKMTVAELQEKFVALQEQEKQNAADKAATDQAAAAEQKRKDDEAVAEQKRKDEAAAKADAEKQNSFNTLLHANRNSVKPIVIETASDKTKRGQELYS